MDARDATANNAELWTQYLRDQWRLFLDPFGLANRQMTDTAASTLAEAAAATVASALTMWIAPPIGQMCHETTLEVDAALDEAEEIEIPAEYAAHPKAPCADPTQHEEWLVSSSAGHAVEAY